MKKIELSDLTLREKIGQTLMIRDAFWANLADKEEYLKKYPVGGVWSFGAPAKKDSGDVDFNGAENVDPGSSAVGLAIPLEMTKHLKVPPIIAADTVGGYNDLTKTRMSQMAIGATGEPKLAALAAGCLAEEFKCAGVRWIWSPVADLYHRENAAMIGRSFCDDPDLMIEMSKEFVSSCQSHGVAAGMKHFPGGGVNSKRDTHLTPEKNDMTLEEWRATQGRIYKEIIDSGVYTVMTTHASFPAVDDTRIGKQYIPATFSKKITTDLLKNEMGFEGVVITDDLYMRAGKALFTREEMYIAALNAGNDVLLGAEMPPEYLPNYIDVIEQAVKDGRVSIERIDDAAGRVLRLKEKLGLFGEDVYLDHKLPSEVTRATRDAHSEITDRAVTLVANDAGLLPLDPKKIKKISIVAFAHVKRFYDAVGTLADILRERGIEVSVYEEFNMHISKKIAEESDVIIYAMYLGAHAPFGASSFYGDVMKSFFNVMCYGAEKSIPVSFGSPNIYYDYFEDCDTFINAYTYCDPMLRSFAKAIFGEIKFEGTSPFKLIP